MSPLEFVIRSIFIFCIIVVVGFGLIGGFFYMLNSDSIENRIKELESKKRKSI